MKKVGIIVGSTRDGRISESIAKYVVSKASNSDKITYSLIDLKSINLPLLDEPYPAAMAKYQHAHTINWSNLIKNLDGFIVITPEYNHGYPAALKNAFDFLYSEWNGKPLAFIGYGYSAIGSRAVMQLRQVVSALQLKAIAKETLINLATNAKDGEFVSDDKVDQQLLSMLSDLEKTFN